MYGPAIFSYVFTQNKMKNMYMESLIVYGIHNNPNWIQPKFPLADEWLSKCGKSMQWNTTQPQIHSTIWVNLKIIMLEKQKRVHVIGPYSYKALENAPGGASCKSNCKGLSLPTPASPRHSLGASLGKELES